MKNKIDFSPVISALEQKEHFIIASHVLPDGDSLGSTLSLGLALKKLGKKVEMLCPDAVPLKYRFLPGSEYLKREIPSSIHEDTIVFILDCSDEERLGDLFTNLSSLPIINIDHHSSNTYFGQVNIVKEDAAATGQIIFYLLEQLDLLDPEIALNLYVAIVTDTGSFKFANTTAEAHFICAKLLSFNLEPDVVSQKVFDEKPISTMLLLKEALGSLCLEKHGVKIAWMKVDDQILAKCGASREELDGIVNYARNITGVEVGMLFYLKNEGEIKVALRSKSKINVAKIAEKFGGGGHRQAAGCRFNNLDFETAKRKIINVIGEYCKIGQA
ncbi:MAG: bifunctional oligoribonuclease/PAP phosphatase NrnA [Firmicutes bacterium]|nr:bifunctional oligoribonuclease/PAP phosphatase NrnA [Bacillota bacterium]